MGESTPPCGQPLMGAISNEQPRSSALVRLEQSMDSIHPQREGSSPRSRTLHTIAENVTLIVDFPDLSSLSAKDG